ncbi:MAG: T9SS C-terminal target domain-containing protein [Bacteroidetes bacterium]|nr:MAG: T9SS C-terminal target domain-containing protein [Bacteroidota bacterium]
MKRSLYSPCIILLIGLVTSFSLPAQEPPLSLEVRILAHNLHIPWDLEWAGEHALIFTERNGHIKRLDLNSGHIRTLFTFPQVAEEQHSGLLGMALHPQWPDSAALYVVYSYYDEQFSIFMRLLRLNYQAGADTLLPADTLMQGIPGASSTTGARVLADPRGYLFLSTGDLDLGTVAQDTQSLSGKVLRLGLDGRIPSDNPFPGNPLWSLGHRNPQGLALSPAGQLYSCEHGTFNNDELNLIEKGRNYGWPLVSGPCDAGNASTCAELNVKAPLLSWTPPIAPCGLAFYASDRFPAWNNSLLMGALRAQGLMWMKMDSSGQAIVEQHLYLEQEYGRIREVLVNPEGRVFVATSNRDSRGTPSAEDDLILEVIPKAVSRAPLSSALPLRGHYMASVQQLQLSLPPVPSPTRISLLNMSGQLLLQTTLPPGQTHATLPLASFPAGLYLLRASSGGRQGMLRFVK